MFKLYLFKIQKIVIYILLTKNIMTVIYGASFISYLSKDLVRISFFFIFH